MLFRSPKVPDNPEFRLSGKISMPELKYIIRHLALGKAPGPIGQLPAEVWRQAPDQVLEIVLNTVNDALSGKQQPDFWKGGRISFLLKKQELQLLKNWRPITLLELSYKIFSAIITKRLQRIAEYYHIYDESQEGFRQGRSTRRQIERITQILHAQRRSKKPVYIAYVDFSNAFNSVDVDAMLYILQQLNFPDTHILQEMYRNSWYQAGTIYGVTAKIPLKIGRAHV